MTYDHDQDAREQRRLERIHLQAQGATPEANTSQMRVAPPKQIVIRSTSVQPDGDASPSLLPKA